ncbi:Uncharacterised protein [Mycobacterium tuberculosis]|nr:Uncharacterised protein [Mycobacterium tuberculosis]CNU51976.1 Uncharacterised protein [Mycobacterium tuberculosis]SGA92967.1 Uncharacterised protein [Mycobacterium tuberculosis]SGB06138.1 Uncharacterised protein [Mycobacterium tuberculosis]SGC76826.1 Uncharacterised protein [Mycobacterium tuberculosis]
MAARCNSDMVTAGSTRTLANGAAVTSRSTATTAFNASLLGLGGGRYGRRRCGVGTRAPRVRTSTTAPVESSAAGAKPAPRNVTRTSDIGAGDTATVGARARSASPSASGAATTWASSVGSSHRTNDAAMPIRSWPCRRATSSMRYVSPCGTGVLERFAKNSCNQSRDLPTSRACRIDCSLTRYTIAVPADSTVATVVRSSASSRCSGPGTTTVRSACTRK